MRNVAPVAVTHFFVCLLRLVLGSDRESQVGFSTLHLLAKKIMKRLSCTFHQFLGGNNPFLFSFAFSETIRCGTIETDNFSHTACEH
jgi:hypothetical protein